MELPRPVWFPTVFAKLLAAQDLTPDEARDVFRDVISGRVDETHTTAIVTALRIKGEAAHEVAEAALALREQMIRLVPISGPVVDTCGTGGDGLGTFNISTAAALVTAAVGVPVVKHGNRAVSSNSGSADVLRELGVPIENGPLWAQQSLERNNFAFCYAPHFHSGMGHVSTLRRKLGVRTIFNLLGPLANPASADYQLLGVGKMDLLETLAAAVARLGTRRAVLVCGYDGLDEVTLSAPTMVRIVEGETFCSEEWTADDFGLEQVPLKEILAEGPQASAAMLRAVLNGEDISARRVVLANAAAALWTANTVPTLKDGVALAAEAIHSGKARALLERLCTSTF